MSLWQSYNNLNPRTRLIFGVSVLAWGSAGLFFSDSIESLLGFTPTEKDKVAVEKYMPKVSAVNK
ncbi:MAG: hypothetical protein M1820_002915 [Bogoriella megaspora]|nr:MAG: hypothetical protein M1820_002915 [Bogoriella megaspora]